MMKDVLEFRTQERKVRVQSEGLMAFRSKDVRRVGVRKFSNEGFVTSASAIGETSVTDLEKECEASAILKIPAEATPTSSAMGQWLSGEDTNPQFLRKVSEHTLDLLASELPNFVVQGHCSQIKNSVSYVNDLGARLECSYNENVAVVDLRRKGSPNITDAFLYYTNHTGFDLDQYLNFQIPFLKTFDEVLDLKPGRHKVLSFPDYTCIGKIKDSLRADKYHEGTAFYSGKMNLQLFNPVVSFSDVKTDLKRGGTTPFDYEGTRAIKDELPLIEEGRMVGLISDLKNQKRHGVESTGNGFRSYNSSVGLSFANFYMSPGRKSAMDLLKTSGDVIYIALSAGGDLTDRGDFSTPVQLAFLVRDGVPVGRLPAFSLNTNLNDMFGKDLLEVSNTYLCSGQAQPLMLYNANILL